MPRRTARISTSDPILEKEENTSEHNEGNKADDVLAPEDLKKLIYLGRLTKTVKIGAFSFEISTLTTAQQRDVMSDIMSSGDTTERMLDIKPLTMAHSVLKVNGLPLEDLCQDDSIQDTIDRRLDVMLNLQSVVMEKLYGEYDAMVTRAGKDVGIDDLKG